MAEPSDDARELLARYRSARVLETRARACVHARLVASIDGSLVPDRRRLVLTVAAVALATAAAVVLAASWWWDPSQAVATPSPRDDAAMFGHDDGTPRQTVIQPAEPPPRVAALPTADPGPATAPIDDVATSSPTPRSIDGASPPGPIPAPIPALAPATRGPDRVLAQELALVRAARLALDVGDAAAALEHLATHSSRFAEGQLAEERDSVRVEALCAAGKGAQARAEAQLFVRRWPDSTHAARMARACPR